MDLRPRSGRSPSPTIRVTPTSTSWAATATTGTRAGREQLDLLRTGLPHRPQTSRSRHGKPWMAVETGAQEDPAVPARKAQWLLDLATTAKQWPELKAVLYFDADKLYPWRIDSSRDLGRGFREMANDPWFEPAASRSPSRVRPRLPVRSPRTPTPSPTPTPTPTPSPTPTPTPLPTGSSSPTPSTTGYVGETVVERITHDGGSPFDQVVDNGGSSPSMPHILAGPGLAAKHEVGYHGNAYYGWGSSFSWSPTWYGRVYVWFDSLPDGSTRLVRSRGDGRLRFAIDLLPSGRLSLRDSGNDTIVTTSSSILTGGWVRIEWMVDHAAARSRSCCSTARTSRFRPTSSCLAGRCCDRAGYRPGADRTIRVAVFLGRVLDRRPSDQHGRVRRTDPLIRACAESRRKRCRDSAPRGMNSVWTATCEYRIRAPR